MCAEVAGTSDFSFLGWMSGDELAAQLASGITFEGQTIAVAITPSSRGAQPRATMMMASTTGSWPAHVCFARECDSGVTAVRRDQGIDLPAV